MTAEWSVPAWALLSTLGVVLVLLVGVVVVVRASTARAEHALATARSESEALRAQVQAIEQRLAPATAPRAQTAVPEPEYVITRLGEEPDDQADNQTAPTVDAPLFADLVLRESVVQAASFAAGLRRALAPEHLNRIRFEMRREIKRARKQRRADARQARREYEARGRERFDAPHRDESAA